MAEDITRFNPEDITEDIMIDIAEDYIEEFELLLNKYKPFLGENLHFQNAMKNMLKFKDIFQKRNGEIL